ncbi:MAG TPA: hypothetical protein VFH69_05650 [Gemmatimonadota bacterium]|nr:hypothetical protein [Gemmatimonadota bacterium]
MNVRVEPNRFLSVACDPDERIVFDRKETTYHLLRDSAARLWDEICEGGTFEVAPVATEGEDPIAMLAEAGLLGVEESASSEGITRRVWLRRTGKVSAAAMVLPLVATITTPTLSLGQDPGGPGPSVDVEDNVPLNEPQIEETLDEQTNGRRRNRRREDKPERETRIRTRTRGRNNDEEVTPTTGSSTTEFPTTGTGTRTRTRTGNQGSTTGGEDLWTRLGRPNDD